MPAEAPAVTKPASAPVAAAIAPLASRCRSSISTNQGRIAAACCTAAGTAAHAPSAVIVPAALMTCRSFSAGRGSGLCIRIEARASPGSVSEMRLGSTRAGVARHAAFEHSNDLREHIRKPEYNEHHRPEFRHQETSRIGLEKIPHSDDRDQKLPDDEAFHAAHHA